MTQAQCTRRQGARMGALVERAKGTDFHDGGVKLDDVDMHGRREVSLQKSHQTAATEPNHKNAKGGAGGRRWVWDANRREVEGLVTGQASPHRRRDGEQR